MQINTTEQDVCKMVKTQLSGQLPKGFELLSVRTAKPKVPVQPCQAIYLLVLKKEYLNEKLKSRVENLLTNKNLNVQRQTDSENPRYKNIDVRPYLKSIELNDAGIIVECKISTVGSIRVDEILELLELNYEMLSAPIRRTNVQWLIN
jgi:hypothetical protein